MLTAIFVKENYKPPPRDSKGIFAGLVSIIVSLKRSFTNSAYLCVLAIYLLSGVVTNFLQGNMVLFVRYSS